MARLPKGWTKLKVIGNVEPVNILVNRDSGKFGTQIVGIEEFVEWPNLADAEAFVKEMNKAGAVEGVIVDSTYHDEPIRLVSIRVRRLGRNWVRMDGTRLPYNITPFHPSAEAAAAIKQKQVEYQAAKEAMRRAKEEAWAIVKTMKLLDSEAQHDS